MTGDCHVRICEGRGVRFPPATRRVRAGLERCANSWVRRPAFCGPKGIVYRPWTRSRS